MADEAPLEATEHGVGPVGPGWFVLNAQDAAWYARPGRGFFCELEGLAGKVDFPQLGLNVQVLAPGEPMSMYHHEVDQEDFLVVAGSAVLLIEGEERPLRAWDFVHCPPHAEHTIVGAGAGPCVVVAVGAREASTGPDWGAYTVDAAAIRHGAGLERETTDSRAAYAHLGEGRPTRYGGWLPDVA
jgi:uncharacterized cupin superfamily protein